MLSSQLRDGVVDPRRNGNRPSVFRFIERIAFWQAERVIPPSATASSALRGRRCSSGACGAQARRTPLQLGCGPSQTLSQTDDVGHQHVPHWSMRLGHLENTTWCLGAIRIWGTAADRVVFFIEFLSRSTVYRQSSRARTSNRPATSPGWFSRAASASVLCAARTKSDAIPKSRLGQDLGDGLDFSTGNCDKDMRRSSRKFLSRYGSSVLL